VDDADAVWAELATRSTELLNRPINREWVCVMPASPIPTPRVTVELPRVVESFWRVLVPELPEIEAVAFL